MNRLQAYFKNFKWTKMNIAMIILIVILLLVLSLFGYYKSSLSAISKKDEVVYFQVVEGDSVSSVTDRLEEQKVIKNASVAKISAKLNGVDDFTVGSYQINRSWNATKILKYMGNPKNVINDQVLITFKEGIWAKDIAELIGKNTNVSAKELIALWNDPAFLETCIEKYEFLDDSILNEEYRIKLEGYLFPETYYFKKDTTPEAVTYTFLDQFNVEYQSIKEEIEKSDLSVHELVTLASIVQYESSSVEDMHKIAGVFYNRLAIDQKLESSVTVCYALYDFDSWIECEKNSGIDSPYNTYKNKGLPIGPILNPGKDAIEATLKPTKHDYLYFIADVQGDNTVYYAKTFEEHLKNVKKYLDY